MIWVRLWQEKALFLIWLLLAGLASGTGAGPSGPGPKGADVAPNDPVKRLADELAALYQSGGENGVREFVRKDLARLDGKTLVGVTLMVNQDRSASDRNRAILAAAVAAAEEKGEPKTLVDVLVQAGDFYRYTFDKEKAENCYIRAYPLYEAAKDLMGQGRVLASRGSLAFYAGDNARALDFYEKALPFLERAGSVSGQGNVYFRRGEVYLVTGDNALAQAMFDQALPLFEKAGNVLGQGNVYRSRGELHSRLADYARAMDCYQNAIRCYEKVNSEASLATVYKNQGIIFQAVGDNPQARMLYEKALGVLERTGDVMGQGEILLHLGEIQQESRGYDQALALYDRAYVHLEKAGDPLGLGNLFYERGNVYRKKADYPLALAMYEKALPLYQKAGAFRSQGNVYRRFGDVYRVSGDAAKALEMYEKALAIHQRCDSIENQSQVLSEEGEVYAQGGKRDVALAKYRGALDLLEKIRRRSAVDEFKVKFLERVVEYFEQACAFMLSNGFPEEAFRTLERMRARLFLDRLAEGQVPLEKGVPAELQAQQVDLETKLEQFRARRLRLLGPGPAPEDREQAIAKAENDMAEAEKRLAEVKVNIRMHNPLYASVEYPEAVSVGEMRTAVIRPGEAVLEYSLGTTGAWCFVLTRETFRVVKLPGTTDGLTGQVQRFLANLAVEGSGAPAAGNARQAAGTPALDGLARSLGDLLIAPLEKDLRGKSLIIVPDGILARLPFELLMIGKPNQRVRLIDRHPVQYTPSASVLAFYRTKPHGPAPAESFIGFGDPVYDFDSYQAGLSERGKEIASGYRGADLSRPALQLDRIPGSGEEVKAVGELFKGQGCTVKLLLRDEAREDRLRSPDVASYGYIHVAAHVLLGDDFQAIALSQTPGARNDGLLGLGDIMNLKWAARLVVLSACKTGLGPSRRGEGVMGLTRAVMYAGSPAAVVSLWSVSDEGTRELMTRFYRDMIVGHRSPAEALRKAKLELMHNPRWSSPFIWAAFVLYGE